MNIYAHQNQFFDNKYTALYYRIILNAQSQNRKKLNKNNSNYVYYEKHHILPECWWSEYKKEKWNLVLLTAKEHFICHLLLTKMTYGELKHKMIYGINKMLRKSNNQDRFIPCSNVYLKIKQEMIKISSASQKGKTIEERCGEEKALLMKAKMSAAHKGKKFSDEHRAKLSVSRKGKPGIPCPNKNKTYIEMYGEERALLIISNIVNSQKGKTIEERCGEEKALLMKAKMSAAHKGKPKSAEHNSKNSLAHKGKKFTDQHRANISAARKKKFQK